MDEQNALAYKEGYHEGFSEGWNLFKKDMVYERMNNTTELCALVERLIIIKDSYDLLRSERDTISEACNILYHNRELLAEVNENED